MKVLYVSKASVVAAYQAKLRSLAAFADVDAVIPQRWGRDVAVTTDVGRARIHPRPVVFHGQNHFHLYTRAGAELRLLHPDIVHIDEEPYSAATFQWAVSCRRQHIPFVFFAWQNIDKDLPQPFRGMRKYVFKHAAAGIAGSERAAAVLRYEGFRREIAVIPQLGVDPDHFEPDLGVRAAARARLDIADTTFVVGFAGRLVHEKGVDLLLDAVAPLPDVVAIVIGDGPEKAALMERAKDHDMRGRTRFLGRVGSLDMPIWLNALDVLALPSRRTQYWEEQFGRVLIEAMACGVVPIGAESGEIPNVIGDAGLTFVEDDVDMLRTRIVALRNDRDTRRRLAALGRERVFAHFTHERVARDTVALYRRVFAPATAETRS